MFALGFQIESRAYQPDGKLVAGGHFPTDDDSCPFVVARFHADGTGDRSFGENGFVTTRVGTCEDQLGSLEVQSDGKIVVVGTSYHHGATSEIVVLRFEKDGQLDLGFGSQGIVALNLSSGYDQGHEVIVEDCGKILIVAEKGSPTGQWGLVRLDAKGSLDSSFAPQLFIPNGSKS